MSTRCGYEIAVEGTFPQLQCRRVIAWVAINAHDHGNHAIARCEPQVRSPLPGLLLVEVGRFGDLADQPGALGLLVISTRTVGGRAPRACDAGA